MPNLTPTERDRLRLVDFLSCTDCRIAVDARLIELGLMIPTSGSTVQLTGDGRREVFGR